MMPANETYLGSGHTKISISETGQFRVSLKGKVKARGKIDHNGVIKFTSYEDEGLKEAVVDRINELGWNDKDFIQRLPFPGLKVYQTEYKKKNPFSGYKDFDACVRSMSRKIGVYSPRGLCASIERRRKNPVAELIQTRRVKPRGTAVEYVDVDEKQKFHGVMAAPGIRMVIGNKKFVIGYAIYVQDGDRWRWLTSEYLVHGTYDLDRGEVTIPDQTGLREKSLVKPALALFEWIQIEREGATVPAGL